MPEQGGDCKVAYSTLDASDHISMDLI